MRDHTRPHCGSMIAGNRVTGLPLSQAIGRSDPRASWKSLWNNRFKGDGIQRKFLVTPLALGGTAANEAKRHPIAKRKLAQRPAKKQRPVNQARSASSKSRQTEATPGKSGTTKRGRRARKVSVRPTVTRTSATLSRARGEGCKRGQNCKLIKVCAHCQAPLLRTLQQIQQVTPITWPT